VLILLPPSEGKTAAAAGPPVDLEALSFPSLTPTRRRVGDALVSLSGRPKAAREVLALGPAQAEDLARNARLWEEPAAPAIEVYSGVLYDALSAGTLDRRARRRLGASVVIASALFGLVRPDDLIPAYRLSGTVRLPRLGPVAAQWRTAIPVALDDHRGVILDLRSGTYVSLGAAPAGSLTVRVLTDREGRRIVVSHGNKATKGLLVRRIVETGATTVADVLACCHDQGWAVDRTEKGFDVIVPSE
jgi:cytoplasmic iron level regulating protein YaaA (DUF328/UPF0246 family)